MTATLSGIFAALPGIENISPDGIQRWLKTRSSIHSIENYLANRILYPQTVPVNEEEKQIDRAIIQEYIFCNPAYFYNPLSHKLIIPAGVVVRIQPLSDLMLILCSILNLSAITPVFILEENTNKEEGCVIIPTIAQSEQKVLITIDGQPSQIEKGKFYHLPVPDQHVKLKISNMNEIMVPGGKIGIVIDLRERKK